MPAKVATACDDSKCTELLVRGDKVSFVSLEQAESVGCYEPACDLHRDDAKMPSDIDMIPGSYVLVHDTESAILPKCQLYILRWRSKKRDGVALPEAVTEYFGKEKPRSGGVEIPEGPWKKVCKVRFVRYTRYGVAPDPDDKTKIVFKPGGHHVNFEHGFDPPVNLYICKRPLSWKLALPDFCVITSKGFEVP